MGAIGNALCVWGNFHSQRVAEVHVRYCSWQVDHAREVLVRLPQAPAMAR